MSVTEQPLSDHELATWRKDMAGGGPLSILRLLATIDQRDARVVRLRDALDEANEIIAALRDSLNALTITERVKQCP